jgi:Uma2 family endonuclease
LKERYTYGDYRAWDDGLRWELIGGEAFCMSPGPNTEHQWVLGNLFFNLKNYFHDGKCRVLTAPLDVMLPEGGEPEDEIDTVVQPDILVLCDKSKRRPNSIVGAPDIVFEILSPSTAERDLTEKLYLYESSGVKEYVIVDPERRVVTVYRRGGEDHFSRRAVCRADGVLEFETFPDLKIPLSSVFQEW